MATLADVPFETRVQAAIEVLASESGLDVPGRYALVYTALWPDHADTPTLEPEPEPVRGPRRSWPADVRAAAVTAYQAGEGSFRVVADRFGLPAGTLKLWVQTARRA